MQALSGASATAGLPAEEENVSECMMAVEELTEAVRAFVARQEKLDAYARAGIVTRQSGLAAHVAARVAAAGERARF